MIEQESGTFGAGAASALRGPGAPLSAHPRSPFEPEAMRPRMRVGASGKAPEWRPADLAPTIGTVTSIGGTSLGARTRADGFGESFQQVLRREQRRADRSKRPLSLIVVQPLALDAGQAEDGLGGLLQALRDCIRETDRVGALDDGRLVVLCPDTDSAGASCLQRKLLERCGALPVTVAQATHPDRLFDTLSEGQGPRADDDMLFGGTAAQRPGYPLKRSLDIAGALLALMLLSPLMVLVAILIKLSSRGPVIFRQKRLGQGGVPFTFYKFRSMAIHSDDRIHREYVAGLIKGTAGEPQGPAAIFKLKSDPRITPFGRFIRKTSIDELPQFWNVLRGDMSLVGPRPPVPYEAAHYQPWHLRRVLELKPGITGIWQVEGRSRVSFDDMVRMDLRYLRECSLGFDLGLLVRTVKVVLRCDGAF